MTDVSGLFAIFICLYGCLRAVQSTSDRAAIQWLIFAALSNAIGGTVRQIAWLGVLLMVPSAAWVLRRRRGVLVVTAILWSLSVAFIAGCMHWFKIQPHSMTEPLLPQPYSASEHVLFHIHYLSRTYLALLLLSLPILIAFVAGYPIREHWARVQAGVVIAAFLLVGGLCGATWHITSAFCTQYLLAPFARAELSTKGFDLGGFAGTRPDVLSMPIRLALTLFTFSAFLAFLLSLANASRRRKRAVIDRGGPISNQTLLTILGPFTAGYLILMVTRAAVFERYFLPFLCIVLLFLVRFYQANVAAKLPMLTVVFVTLFAVYGVTVLHDFFAADRATLEAADELRAAGVPRTEFWAGYAYDALTQIELTGYVLPKQPWHAPSECEVWWDRYTPAIHGRYLLSYSPSCSPESKFPPIKYSTWLAPHHQEIYILKVLN